MTQYYKAEVYRGSHQLVAVSRNINLSFRNPASTLIKKDVKIPKFFNTEDTWTFELSEVELVTDISSLNNKFEVYFYSHESISLNLNNTIITYFNETTKGLKGFSHAYYVGRSGANLSQMLAMVKGNGLLD